MVCRSNIGVSNYYSTLVTDNCPDEGGCLANVCPNFTIKRHDVKPPLRVKIEDCDGPLDLREENLVLEANMWAKARLKAAITDAATYFGFADNIGFNQVMVGDVLVFDQVRRPEHMLVTGFDEINHLIQVQRGYNGTPVYPWAKGQALRIFRVLNGTASIESVTEDRTQEDGTVLSDQLVQTNLVYEWQANDTCLPGCYWLEFKLLKMDAGMMAQAVTPSFTPSSFTPSDFGCGLGLGVEWARRFPETSEGFLVKIVDSPTAEL